MSTRTCQEIVVHIGPYSTWNIIPSWSTNASVGVPTKNDLLCATHHNNSLDASGVSGLLIHNLSAAQSSAAASTQPFDGRLCCGQVMDEKPADSARVQRIVMRRRAQQISFCRD